MKVDEPEGEVGRQLRLNGIDNFNSDPASESSTDCISRELEESLSDFCRSDGKSMSVGAVARK